MLAISMAKRCSLFPNRRAVVGSKSSGTSVTTKSHSVPNISRWIGNTISSSPREVLRKLSRDPRTAAIQRTALRLAVERPLVQCSAEPAFLYEPCQSLPDAKALVAIKVPLIARLAGQLSRPDRIAFCFAVEVIGNGHGRPRGESGVCCSQLLNAPSAI